MRINHLSLQNIEFLDLFLDELLDEAEYDMNSYADRRGSNI